MTGNTVSIFSINELPAWSEIMNDYYKGIFLRKSHLYNPDDTSCVIDTYWKIPRKKVIIAMICNQFNKMIHEDGYREGLLELINKTHMKKAFKDHAVAYDVRFSASVIPDMGKDLQILGAEEWDNFEQRRFENPESLAFIAGTALPIYRFTNPNGHKDPFISNHPGINVNDIHSTMCVFPMVKISSTSGDGKQSYTVIEILPFMYTDTYIEIIEYMMSSYKEYFEGEIGWKDHDGNVINNPTPIIGYDGAL